MWISLYFLAVPIGIIVGYFSTSLIIGGDNHSNSYRYGFLIQTVLMTFPTTVCFLFFPAKYFDKVDDEDTKPSASAINEQSISGNEKRKTLRVS